MSARSVQVEKPSGRGGTSPSHGPSSAIHVVSNLTLLGFVSFCFSVVVFWLPRWVCALAILAAGIAQSKKFKGVKEQLKIARFRRVHANAMDGAVFKCLRGSAVHTGEMVLVAIHRRIQRFAVWQMSTPHLPALLKLAQVSVNGCQAHRSGAAFQLPMQLLPAHLIVTAPQLVQQQLLTLGGCGSLLLHGHLRPQCCGFQSAFR